MPVRGSGRTSAQMREASLRSHFVWCNERLDYPQALALSLGREDLRIHPASALADGARRLAGIDPRLIILDHALVPTQALAAGVAAVSERRALRERQPAQPFRMSRGWV